MRAHAPLALAGPHFAVRLEIREQDEIALFDADQMVSKPFHPLFPGGRSGGSLSQFRHLRRTARALQPE